MNIEHDALLLKGITKGILRWLLQDESNLLADMQNELGKQGTIQFDLVNGAYYAMNAEQWFKSSGHSYPKLNYDNGKITRNYCFYLATVLAVSDTINKNPAIDRQRFEPYAVAVFNHTKTLLWGGQLMMF